MGLVDITVFVGRFGNLEQSLTSVFSNYKDQSLTCKFVHGHDMDSKMTWGGKKQHIKECSANSGKFTFLGVERIVCKRLLIVQSVNTTVVGSGTIQNLALQQSSHKFPVDYASLSA